MMRANVLLVLAIALQGCAATITCPPVEGPPRAVVLLDHGDHASIAVERSAGSLVRYSYGDRSWYAEDDTRLRSGLAALFQKTPAVLSRREFNSATDAASVTAALRMQVTNAWGLATSPERADTLIERLDAIFYADPGQVFYSDTYRLEFAPHPVPYTIGNNSNHMVAIWLDELGCTTRGNPLTSTWRVSKD